MTGLVDISLLVLLQVPARRYSWCMRREQHFGMKRADALAFLGRATVHHLATTNRAGAPILRVVHGVVEDDALYFHGAPAGEKMDALGREAVISVEEVVAEIPSWFADPEREIGRASCR